MADHPNRNSLMEEVTIHITETPPPVVQVQATDLVIPAWSTAPKTTGYAVYSDTEYTEGNEFRVEAGVWTSIPNNAGRVFETHLPDGIGGLPPTRLYDAATQRLLIKRSGDQMGFRIDLNVRPSVSGVRCLLGIDIRGSQGVFAKKSFVLGEAGVAEDHSETIAPAFGGDTFLSNGGQVVLYTPHPVDIFGVVYLCSVESQARATI